mmetsp:Transcript_20492/g.56599  ORF Transcript_20492/g.56599 Transcript_20492/m.56599 type:complete len:85 (+) Transcript_20492:576-830(+)
MARERGGGGHWCIEYLHGCACEPMVLHISEALSSPLPSNAKESSPTGPRGPSHAPPGRRQGAVVCASQLLCNACLRSSRPAGSL